MGTEMEEQAKWERGEECGGTGSLLPEVFFFFFFCGRSLYPAMNQLCQQSLFY